MKEEIFRKKSIDRITSPDQMDACVKVVTTPIWMGLAAIALFLIGILIWGMFGQVETRVYVQAISDGSSIICTLSENTEEVEIGETVRIDDAEFIITDVYTDTTGNDIVTIDGKLPEGSYDAVIVTDVIRPIKFLTN